MYSRFLLFFIGFSGFCGVALGAVAAHIVKDPSAISLIEKASLYQLIHTLALLSARKDNAKLSRVIQVCWMSGILLFSGSLYFKAFAFTSSSTLAPFGGTLLMAGWLGLILRGFIKNN